MNKIILKSALIAIAAIVLGSLIVFAMWILISPQTMASSCEKTGNYTFAVTCADLRYKYTNNINDLARCEEDSILSGKDSLIIKYGEKLLSEEGFEELCQEKDKQLSEVEYGENVELSFNYKAYICGHLSAAQYRGGSLEKAISAAEKGESFTKLVIEIIENGTKSDAEKVRGALGSDENLTKLLDEFINN